MRKPDRGVCFQKVNCAVLRATASQTAGNSTQDPEIYSTVAYLSNTLRDGEEATLVDLSSTTTLTEGQ
jgi:hypothetical protein